mgnify:CR=1 FL=1
MKRTILAVVFALAVMVPLAGSLATAQEVEIPVIIDRSYLEGGVNPDTSEGADAYRLKSLDLNKSERSLWYAVQMYDMFPEYRRIEELPEGKNLSMNKLITKYLTDGKKEEKPEPEYRCPQCHYRGFKSGFKL